MTHHETFNDALIDVVKALGGSKVVGSAMRPELPASQAGAWLRDSLNPDRREKLSPEQVLFLLRRSCEVGYHGGMDFVGAQAHYRCEPVEPEVESVVVMREYMAAVAMNEAIAKRMERAAAILTASQARKGRAAA